MCICSAGGRSGPWFREHRYPEKRNRDEEENRRAGQITRHAAAPTPEAHGGKKETPGQRGQNSRHVPSRHADTARRELYPALEPFRHGYLRRLGRPRIYYENAATRRANRRCSCTAVLAPVPTKRARQFFDPQHYRIVGIRSARLRGAAVQARASSRIRPGNLVADIERLRNTLEIERWLVFGGIVGQHLGTGLCGGKSERVSEIVLRGFSCCGTLKSAGSTSTAPRIYFPMRGGVPRRDPADGTR